MREFEQLISLQLLSYPPFFLSTLPSLEYQNDPDHSLNRQRQSYQERGREREEREEREGGRGERRERDKEGEREQRAGCLCVPPSGVDSRGVVSDMMSCKSVNNSLLSQQLAADDKHERAFERTLEMKQ